MLRRSRGRLWSVWIRSRRIRSGDPGGSEGLRDAFERIGRFLSSSGAGTGWSAIFEDLSRRSRPAPETAGEAGDGVWAIYTVDADGGARVEQVYATELDALRANKDNTDPKRKVRFLPYGIAVSVLDDPVDEAQ